MTLPAVESISRSVPLLAAGAGTTSPPLKSLPATEPASPAVNSMPVALPQTWLPVIVALALAPLTRMAASGRDSVPSCRQRPLAVARDRHVRRDIEDAVRTGKGLTAAIVLALNRDRRGDLTRLGEGVRAGKNIDRIIVGAAGCQGVLHGGKCVGVEGHSGDRSVVARPRVGHGVAGDGSLAHISGGRGYNPVIVDPKSRASNCRDSNCSICGTKPDPEKWLRKRPARFALLD